MENSYEFNFCHPLLGLQSAWCIVFVCRIWWAWIQHKEFPLATTSKSKGRNSKEKFFVTKTAYLSVELNAHNLLYIIRLVKEKRLPEEALNIYLFNSQSCESMFRNIRSLSGTYSSIINFTVADFLRRSQKISILNGIKCEQLSQDDDKEYLSFPTHHKHKRDRQLSKLQNFVGIDQLDIEKVIENAFAQAIQLTGPLNVSKLLKEYDLLTMNSLSKYVFQQMNSNSKMFDYSTQTVRDESDEFSLDEDDEEDDGQRDGSNDGDIPNDDEEFDDNIVDEEEDGKDDGLETVKVCFDGMRIRDRIDPRWHDSYFKMKINGQQKFMHK
jgi:hypothetical protein